MPLQLKLFEFSVQELPRGEALAEYAQGQVNHFLKEHPDIEVVQTHVNTTVIPPEEGGGVFKDAPSSVVIVVAIFYRG